MYIAVDLYDVFLMGVTCLFFQLCYKLKFSENEKKKRNSKAI